jgi:hypothetical protein
MKHTFTAVVMVFGILLTGQALAAFDRGCIRTGKGSLSGGSEVPE